MKRYLLPLIIVGAALSMVPASAHHSVGVGYLVGEVVTIHGEIVGFILRNPHPLIYVTVTEKDGTDVRYTVETGSTSHMRMRITRDTVTPGDQVVVIGHPGRNPAEHRVRMIRLFRPRDGFVWDDETGEVAIQGVPEGS